MKIAHVVCSLISGGAEKLASELALSLHQRGHDVDIILIDRFTHCQYEEAMINRLREGGIRVLSLKRRPGSGYAAVGSLARLLVRIVHRRYDIIHSHLRLSHLYVGVARLVSPVAFRHILTVHNTRERWRRLTFKLVHNATVVFCSEAAADEFQFNFKRNVIPNGIKHTANTSHNGDVTRLRSALGIPITAAMLISVGNLTKQKNYPKAIEAVSLLQAGKPEADFHYVICGAGPEEGVIKQQVESLSLEDRIHLLGDRSDVHDLLKVADCFISMSLYEGLPLSVLEAFFSGIRCVLSPIREHRDISGGVAGCVLAADTSPESMATAVLQVFEQAKLRKELKKLRSPHLKLFSLETCVRSYEELYKSLIDR